MVLKPRPERILLLVGGCVAFVALGVWLLPQNRQVALLSIVFFGACALVGSISLIPGATWLRVGQEGFQSRVLFFTRRLVRWSDIARFDIYTVNRTRFLGWTWRFERSGRTSALNQALGAPDGSISTLFGSPEELLRLFEEARASSPAPSLLASRPR